MTAPPNELSEVDPKSRYDNRTLTVDQYYLHKLGLSRDGTELKIGEFDLFGVPVSLSMNSGRFLLVLSPKEQVLFKEFVGEPLRLFLRTRHNRDERADLRIILINGKITSMENLAQNPNLCLLGATYIHSPEIYRERLSSLFFDADYFLDKYYKAVDRSESRVPYEKLIPDRLSSHAFVRCPDSGKREGKIISVNPCGVELYMESNGMRLVADAETSVEFQQSGYSFFVKATVSSIRPSPEVSGFAFLELKLAFHPSLLELLVPTIAS